MRNIDLPSTADSIAGARLLDLVAAEGLVGTTFPDVVARSSGDTGPHIALLVGSFGPETAPTLVGAIAELIELGTKVSVISHFAPPANLPSGVVLRKVAFGEPLEDAISTCDLVVATHWEFVLPARRVAVAPVVHLELGDFHLDDPLPARVQTLVTASVSSAHVTLVCRDSVQQKLLHRYGVASTEIRSTQLASALLGLVQVVCDTAPASAPVMNPVDLSGLSFEHRGDERLLRTRLETAGNGALEIPISQPAWRGLRVVRWRVIVPGDDQARSQRIYLPARIDEPMRDSSVQPGIDYLREERREEALEYFLDCCRQRPLSDQVVIGRWLVLSLLEVGRNADAAELALAFGRDFPAHPDYLSLAIVACRSVGNLFDIAGPLESVRLLGHGARYEEWFEEPIELLNFGQIAA